MGYRRNGARRGSKCQLLTFRARMAPRGRETQTKARCLVHFAPSDSLITAFNVARTFPRKSRAPFRSLVNLYGGPVMLIVHSGLRAAGPWISCGLHMVVASLML